jgi:hypothetical protein
MEMLGTDWLAEGVLDMDCERDEGVKTRLADALAFFEDAERGSRARIEGLMRDVKG